MYYCVARTEFRWIRKIRKSFKLNYFLSVVFRIKKWIGYQLSKLVVKK